ncbi:MAG: hypothetical protein IJS63_06750 [Bacteroidaceae bacterium]|jgi:hypothetical protein|nr:hypothetical protein [Bacteroidaceae bacterium]
MKEQEILEMQRLIDEGVRRAQSRLWQRAGAAHQSLIVCRNGKILELVPDVEQGMMDGSLGDPLARRKQR